jgi:hypothetical protein
LLVLRQTLLALGCPVRNVVTERERLAASQARVLRERTVRANQRETVFRELERVADERGRIADERERIADEREWVADERERAIDERDGAAAQREQERCDRAEERPRNVASWSAWSASKRDSSGSGSPRAASRRRSTGKPQKASERRRAKNWTRRNPRQAGHRIRTDNPLQ